MVSRRMIAAGLMVLAGGLCAGVPSGGQTAAQSNLTGTLTVVSNSQITFQTAGRSLVLTLTAGTTIRVDEKIVMAADLRAGMTALIVTDGKTVSDIRAVSNNAMSQPAEPAAAGQRGIIGQVGNGQFSLLTGTQTVVFTLSSATVIRVDGKVATAVELKSGMSAIVLAPEGKPVAEIAAYSPRQETQPATRPPATGTRPATTQAATGTAPATHPSSAPATGR